MINGVAYVQADIFHGVVSILMNDTLSSLDIFLLGLGRPPIDEVSMLIELPALVVKAVRYFVANDEADGAVIHVPRSIVAEESALENARGEFCESTLRKRRLFFQFPRSLRYRAFVEKFNSRILFSMDE